MHDIHFDIDAAVIRPEAAPVLAALSDGLKADQSTAISIEVKRRPARSPATTTRMVARSIDALRCTVNKMSAQAYT
jgi:hypothetical protein